MQQICPDSQVNKSGRSLTLAAQKSGRQGKGFLYDRKALQKKETVFTVSCFSVRKMRLELTRYEYHKILSLARLPIPTLPRTCAIISKVIRTVNSFLLSSGSL